MNVVSGASKAWVEVLEIYEAFQLFLCLFLTLQI